MIVTGAVAALTFWVAYDGGGYGVDSRTSLAIGLLWALLLGAVLGLRRVRLSRAGVVVCSAFAALALLDVASSFWAGSAESAFAEFDRTVLYLAAVSLAVSTRRARNVAAGLAFGIAAVGVLALASRLFPQWLGTDATQQFLPSTFSRLSYPLNYWNGLAIFLALGVPLLLGVALASRSRVFSALAVAPIPLLACGIYLASSRGGWLVAVVGALAFVWLAEHRLAAAAAVVSAAAGSAAALGVLNIWPRLVDPAPASHVPLHEGVEASLLLGAACAVTGLVSALLRKPAERITGSRSAVGAIVFAAVATVAVGIVALHPVRRFEEFKRPPALTAGAGPQSVEAHLLSSNGSGRWQFWTAAIDEFESRPLLGRGAGSYRSWWSQHGSLPVFVQDAHSLYVETLGELGIVGLLVVLAAVATALAGGVRRTLRIAGRARASGAGVTATAAAYAVGAGVDWMWEMTAVSLVGVACLGLCIASREKLSRATRVPVRAVVAVAAAALIGAQGVVLLSHLSLTRSRGAAAAGDAAAARTEALRSRDLEPWGSSAYLQLGLLAEQSKSFREAHAWLDDAIARNRIDWELWLVAARVDVEQGRIRRARAELAEARRLDPHSPIFALQPR